jgi:N-acyl-D-amino-acid deacylase
VALLFLTLKVVAQLPTTGAPFASLAAADQRVTHFMVKGNLPGGAVGFVRDGKRLFFRGYSYADRDTREVVQPDSLFRLASLSQAFTAYSGGR